MNRSSRWYIESLTNSSWIAFALPAFLTLLTVVAFVCSFFFSPSAQGAIAISFNFWSTSICFVCAHLAAHEGSVYLNKRRDMYRGEQRTAGGGDAARVSSWWWCGGRGDDDDDDDDDDSKQDKRYVCVDRYSFIHPSIHPSIHPFIHCLFACLLACLLACLSVLSLLFSPFPVLQKSSRASTCPAPRMTLTFSTNSTTFSGWETSITACR